MEIDDVLSHYQFVFKEKAITVKIDLTDVKVNGHSRKLHQVISNLLSNASKYTDEDGEFIITSEDVGDSILYKFTNTCTTLQEENLSLLWEKFYRTKIRKDDTCR